ncbi:MAG: FAD:protein FMN transferase [Methylocella sp.]
MPPDELTIAKLLEFVGVREILWRRPRISFPLPGIELDFGGLEKEYAADRAATAWRCRRFLCVMGLVPLLTLRGVER